MRYLAIVKTQYATIEQMFDSMEDAYEFVNDKRTQLQAKTYEVRPIEEIKVTHVEGKMQH